MLHIGNRIREVFEQQPKSHNIEWFAEQLHCRRNNIYNIFRRPSIDVEMLYRISRVLEHDFFRDLSADLLREEQRTLSEQQNFYNDMMLSIGRMLTRKLRRVEISSLSEGFQINKWDAEESLLSPSKFVVSVKTGENVDVVPHVHVYSLEEKFDLRFTIGEPPIKLLPVLKRGKRSNADTFDDIRPLAEKWLSFEKSAAALYAFENRKFATVIYNTVNPRQGSRNALDDREDLGYPQ